MFQVSQRKRDGAFILLSRVFRDFVKLKGKRNLRVLIIGDSHAVQHYKHLAIDSDHNSYVLCWLGPKLMHTIANEGFGMSSLQLLALKLWKPNICFIWIGEIDVRMHLVKHMDSTSHNLEWVDSFLFKLMEFWQQINKPKIFLLSPVPQVKKELDSSEFPSFGSLSDRIVMQKRLVSKCQTLIAKGAFPITYVDIATELQYQDGSLNKDYSDDDCHLHSSGFEIVRHLWEQEI